MKNASVRKPETRHSQPGFMVKALVLDHSVLNVLVSSRNIVDFFAESLSELTKNECSPESVILTANQCRYSMEKLLHAAKGSLKSAVVLTLKEFLMEVDSICRILEEQAPIPSSPAAVSARVEGKMYKVRYLSNMLGNEIAEIKKISGAAPAPGITES